MAKAVTIYTTPTCAYCHLAKEWLNEHQIKYTEKDVLTDAAAQEELVAKSHQKGVPVLDIEGEIVVGFDRSRLEALLGEEQE